jgi:hypothetical protein
MMRECKPYLGPTQPQSGQYSSVAFTEVKRQSKGHLPGSVIRGVLAQNVISLRDWKWSHLPNPTKRNEALADLCKPTSKSQIQRITSQSLGTSIDVLERLSIALEVRPQDLITPYFANTFLQSKQGERRDQDNLQGRSGRLAPLARKA